MPTRPLFPNIDDALRASIAERKRRQRAAVEARRDRVTALYVNGNMSLAEVAAEIGIGSKAVRRDLAVRGIKRRPRGRRPRQRPPERVKRVGELRAQGKLLREIAEIVGISVTTVSLDLKSAHAD